MPSLTPTGAPTTPTSSTSTTPTAPVSPTATTPALTGAAVRPGEVPPTISPYVEHDTSDGALAFAAYFYRALDWSIATTNANLLRSISAPTCTSCRKYINGLDSLAASGGHSEGGRIHVTKVAMAKGTLVKADYVVQITALQGAEVITSPGAPPSTYGPRTDQFVNYLYVAWRASGWQALEIELG